MSKFYVWIDNPTTQVEDVEEFNSESQRINGFVPETRISSKVINTALRQANLVAAAFMNVLNVADTVNVKSSLATVQAAIDSRLKNFISTYSPESNILKSVGAGSSMQKNGGVSGSSPGSTVADAIARGISAIALNARTEANGDCSCAQGYNAKAHNKGDAAFNSSKAGLTLDEFNTLYPGGYYYNNEYLNYESYNHRILSAAFSVNKGHAKGPNTFSAGEHNVNHGSVAPNSATFGFWCDTSYGEEQTDDGNGGLTTYFKDAKNSLCGGRYASCAAADSIVYGSYLIVPPLANQAKAIFGTYNKNWHDDEGVEDYKTIMEIGNGTGNGVLRSNAFAVTTDGRAKVSGIPKDSNDLIRLKDLHDRVPTPPHYTTSDNGTYVFKATVSGSGTDNYQVTYRWVKE